MFANLFWDFLISMDSLKYFTAFLYISTAMYRVPMLFRRLDLSKSGYLEYISIAPV